MEVVQLRGRLGHRLPFGCLRVSCDNTFPSLFTSRSIGYRRATVKSKHSSPETRRCFLRRPELAFLIPNTPLVSCSAESFPTRIQKDPQGGPSKKALSKGRQDIRQVPPSLQSPCQHLHLLITGKSCFLLLLLTLTPGLSKSAVSFATARTTHTDIGRSTTAQHLARAGVISGETCLGTGSGQADSHELDIIMLSKARADYQPHAP